MSRFYPKPPSLAPRASAPRPAFARAPRASADRLRGAVHPFFRATRPLVFAHRGGSALAPENTLAAFDNGLSLGADGLELDVHLSRDGVVVVHHDRLLDRTTTLRGPIAERSADELRKVDVPGLAEVLARYPHARVIIEL